MPFNLSPNMGSKRKTFLPDILSPKNSSKNIEDVSATAQGDKPILSADEALTNYFLTMATLKTRLEAEHELSKLRHHSKTQVESPEPTEQELANLMAESPYTVKGSQKYSSAALWDERWTIQKAIQEVSRPVRKVTAEELVAMDVVEKHELLRKLKLQKKLQL